MCRLFVRANHLPSEDAEDREGGESHQIKSRKRVIDVESRPRRKISSIDLSFNATFQPLIPVLARQRVSQVGYQVPVFPPPLSSDLQLTIHCFSMPQHPESCASVSSRLPGLHPAAGDRISNSKSARVLYSDHSMAV